MPLACHGKRQLSPSPLHALWPLGVSRCHLSSFYTNTTYYLVARIKDKNKDKDSVYDPPLAMTQLPHMFFFLQGFAEAQVKRDEKMADNVPWL